MDYTYQVARIRALEVTLLTDQDIDQLIRADSVSSACHFLEDKGWGSSGTDGDASGMLSCEENKISETIADLGIDKSVFDVIQVPRDFHNVKAAVKRVVTGNEYGEIFYDDAALSGSELMEIIKEHDFDRLPDHMKGAAEEAYNALSHTGDGQISDIILDKACMDEILAAGRRAKADGNDVLYRYAVDEVAISDIKIALRGAETGKTKDFLERAVAECEALNKDALIKAALTGKDAIREYLESTDYRDGAEALSEGLGAFEKWCDDRIIESLKREKYETFTIGPVVAYVLARKNEIKTVRMILACKENGLSEEEIRERKRAMYV